MRRRGWLCLAHLGVGLLPGPTGTWGSVVGLGLAWLAQGAWPAGGLYVLLALVVILGIPACSAAEAAYGPDPRQAVVDEVAGQVATLLFAPLNGLTLALGFILFRFFDIAKAPPVSWAERLPGGWGVMADDLLAGLYAGACLGLVWEVLTLRPWPWPPLS